MIESADIKGFEGYSVDRQGNVYNKAGVQLRQEKTRNGYRRVTLSNGKAERKRFLVHRLVAEAFIPNPEGKAQVNHKDQDRTNNHVDNLEWVTPLENLNYSNVIEKASRANERKVKCITTGIIYDSFKSIKDSLGLSHSNIVACCNGRRKTCGGLEWEYLKS